MTDSYLKKFSNLELIRVTVSERIRLENDSHPHHVNNLLAQ